MRSSVRDLRRLVDGLGMTPALLAELHRTAKIRADHFDDVLSPLLLCFAQVMGTLDHTEDSRHPSQGRLQVARFIDRIETAVRGGELSEPVFSELLHNAPARIAAELVKSVGSAEDHPTAEPAKSEQRDFDDRAGKPPHSSADRDAQQDNHEAGADRMRNRRGD